jgi:hypothetical protein
MSLEKDEVFLKNGAINFLIASNFGDGMVFQNDRISRGKKP